MAFEFDIMHVFKWFQGLWHDRRLYLGGAVNGMSVLWVIGAGNAGSRIHLGYVFLDKASYR